jgi:hypothetical protein
VATIALPSVQDSLGPRALLLPSPLHVIEHVVEQGRSPRECWVGQHALRYPDTQVTFGNGGDRILQLSQSGRRAGKAVRSWMVGVQLGGRCLGTSAG